MANDDYISAGILWLLPHPSSGNFWNMAREIYNGEILLSSESISFVTTPSGAAYARFSRGHWYGKSFQYIIWQIANKGEVSFKEDKNIEDIKVTQM